MKATHIKKIKSLITTTSVFALMACGASSSSGTDTTTTTTAFPSNLAVASPLALSTTTQSNTTSRFATTSSSFTSAFSASATEIAAILSGTSSTACTFDPAKFLTTDSNDLCYGPMINYEDHPDSTSGTPENGPFPPGDLGMWSETSTDPASGEEIPCAVAELNTRMDGVSDRSNAALMSAASMFCALTTSGGTVPVNDTKDLYAAMTDLGIADTVFSTDPDAVTLTHSDASGVDVYTYALSFTYLGNNIVVEMVYQPSDGHGRISSLVNTSMTAGNCPSSAVTSNNSLLFEVSAATVKLEARSATFCGVNADGRFDADGVFTGLPNPALKYNAASRPNGWGNNFSIFTAEFDPDTQEGNVFLVWQAGQGDGNTRVFNLNTATNTDDNLDGKAYFGYGADIESTDGAIEGFICNWAGPNADHDLTEDAQYQHVTLDYITGIPSTNDSNLIYAPVNGCNYTPDGRFSFIYDTDDDGSLLDEDPAAIITKDLLLPSDSDGDGTETIEEAITDGGFTLPTAPANL